MIKHPKDSYIVLFLELATPEMKGLFEPVIHMQEIPPHKPSVVGCSSSFMRLDRNLTAFGVWCKHRLHGRLKPDILRPGIVGM